MIGIHGRRVLAACIVTVLGLAGIAIDAPSASAAGNVVPDVGFRACLNSYYLGQPDDAPITPAQLQGIEDPTWRTPAVHCIGQKITSIQGAQYMVNVTSLVLSYNAIADLGPLAGLRNLKQLDLTANRVVDMAPLSGLTNLTWLYVDGNQIADVDALKGLSHLTVLGLDWNRVTSVSPLSTLTNLTYLSLNSNRVSDIEPLAGMVKLTSLGLGDNRVSDIEPLARMVKLTYLDLSNNRVVDVTALSGMVAMKTMNLSENQISDVSSLGGLRRLTWLCFYSDHISDFSVFAGRLGTGMKLGPVYAGAQELTMYARVGVPTPLPVIKVSSASEPVDWSGLEGEGAVVSGDMVTLTESGSVSTFWSADCLRDDPALCVVSGDLTVIALPPSRPKWIVPVVVVGAIVCVGAAVAAGLWLRRRRATGAGDVAVPPLS